MVVSQVSTPRQRGLVDSAYATERAANALGNPDIIADAHQASLDVQAMWVPMLSASLIMARVVVIADRIEEATGTNPLDVDDGPEGGVGTTPATANGFSNGDIIPGVAAAVQDVETSASEAAAATGSALASTLKGLEVVAFLVAAMFIYKAVK